MTGRLGFALLALAAGCATPPETAVLPPPLHPLADPAQAAGADVCAACHAEIAADQAAHPMARTAAPGAGDWFSADMLAKAKRWPEDQDPAPFYEAREGAVRLRAGETAAEVHAVFGSGLRGVTPVSFAPDRRLRELRLSFSRAQDGWIPTPGAEGDADPLGDLDPPEIAGDCLGCHATALAWDAAGRFDPHRAALGVTCERCHGSGIPHLEAQSAGGAPGPIFNPAVLNPAEEVAFCGQCHRQPTDFEPREILARDAGLARHAGGSLMMSACFRESPPESTLACSECHDPHRSEPAVPPARVRAACSRCHQDTTGLHQRTPVAADADCASCHLPTEREAFAGTAFTNHWIRLSDASPPPGSARARDELEWLEALFRPRLEEAHQPFKAARLRLALAELLHIRGARAESRRLLDEALALGPDYEGRLKTAALLRDGGATVEARRILRDAIATDPDIPHAYYELGDLLASTGAPAEAVPLLRQAIERSAASAGLHASLGAALLETDRPVEAVAAFREALRLDPGHAEVLGRLAGVLAAHPERRVRDPEAAVLLAQRLAGGLSLAEPRSLDLLGAAFAAAGDFRRATAAAQEALRLAETNPALAAGIANRLALYRAGRPFVGRLPE